LNEASVEVDVEVGRAEAKALLEALRPESRYGRAPFDISLTRRGLKLKASGRSLGDARVFTNSILRLLKAARQSIEAVD
jgi:tRNA threonylcarbamoyladenosine modification (KEOPS) complex  Pcc1 subunit